MTFATATNWLEPSAALAGQTAIVVGGSRGIGLALARELHAQSCHVCVAARDADRVERVVAELPGALGCAGCDARSAESIDRLFDQVLERFEKVDLVINSAGIGRAAGARLVPEPTSQLSESDWQEVVDTNLRGAFLVARRAARAMIPRRSGQIVHVSSARGALRGLPFAAAYCATKMACRAMFEALAEELRPLGIRAWSLLPDAVDTELIAGTRLANRGSMRAAELAAVVCEMLALPHDAAWENPLVAPFAPAAGGVA